MQNSILKILFPLIFLAMPFAFVHAATMDFDAPTTTVHQGDSFFVPFSFSSPNDSVNALSGTITFSKNLSFQGIEYGSSIVPLWIEQPAYSTTTDALSFSGIIPGGLRGFHEVIFTLLFDAMQKGDVSVSANDITLLKNDGLGTSITTSSSPLTFVIASVGINPQTAKISDTIPPESFTPLIANTKNLFDGNYFVSFGTTDKGSGVDHFEVAETLLFPPTARDWRIVKSPYELSDQLGIQKVYVKAVDKSGNIRIESISAPHRTLAFIIFAIIILVLLCVYFAFSHRFRS